MTFKRNGGNLIPPSEVPATLGTTVLMAVDEVGEAVRSAAVRAGFRELRFSQRHTDGQYTGARRVQLIHLRSNEESRLLVRWRAASDGTVAVEWGAYTQYGPTSPLPDAQARATFEQWFDSEVQSAAQRLAPPAPVVDPVVRPGQRPPESYSGQMYDYHALASKNELAVCWSGTLPIGREAFGWAGRRVEYGPRLFLPHRREELGVLVCAPQGTGKTHLLLTWAAAAAARGQCVFLVDVKGNMRGELEAALTRANVTAEILHFTTARREPSDRMNVLAGIDARHNDAQEQCMLLAEALLPSADSEEYTGKDPLWHRIALRITRAAMQVLKLVEFYRLLDGRRGRIADLTDLYRLVAQEMELVNWIAALRRHEAWVRGQGGQLAAYAVDDCIEPLAIALGRQRWTIRFEDGSTREEVFDDGQRSPQSTYMDYMVTVLQALEPFRPHGFMAPRVRSEGEGGNIRLDRFGRDGRARIVILSAREQDSKLATAVLAMAMKRLRQALDERRNLPAGETGEVLLLLDETSRIAGFDAAGYTTIARQNRVGYVFVYQRLNMIGSDKQIEQLMGNIGTQIYLRGLAGSDLKIFNEHMAARNRDRKMPTEGSAPGSGRSRSSTLQSQEVPFLQAIAAQRLPGGHYPALVCLRDGPEAFLVDLADH
jgi:hypothetical protein